MMKRKILATLFIVAMAMSLQAQKFASVDINYIMKNIPAFESANEQLEQISKKWQKEVDVKMKEVEQMYKNYQTELVFMSEDMKIKKEEEIIEKEKQAHDLKRHYFGPKGELFKKREALIKPIQDEIYTAIQEISSKQGYDAVFDKSSAMSVIYVSTKIDISDIVLKKLGYSK